MSSMTKTTNHPDDRQSARSVINKITRLAGTWRRGARLLWLSVLLSVLMVPSFARAANAAFDGSLVPGCILSGFNYNCLISPTTMSDTANVAGSYIVTIRNGNMTASTLDIGAAGGVIANVTTAGTVTLAANAYVDGTVAAGSTLGVGASGYVTGAVTAGTTITLGEYAHLNSTVNAGTTITLSANAYLGGATTAGTTVTIATYGYVKGSVNAQKTTTLAASAYITGDLTTGTTATLATYAYVQGNLTAGTTATLAANAFVCGNLNSQTTATLAAAAFVCGDMHSPTVTMEAYSYVNGHLSANTATLGAYTCYGSISVSPTLTDAGDGVCSLPRPVTICNQAPPAGGLNHILITHGGTGLTCTPQQVTITACANAACTAPFYTGGVNVTLSPGGQIFAIDSSGVNSTAQVARTTVGTSNLAASTSVATTTGNTCSNTANGTSSCAMTFSDAGFLITVPDHYSETTQPVTIAAVKKSDNSLACIPAFTTAKTINLSCGYVNPTTGTLPLRIGAAPTALAADANSSCSAAGSDQTLTFDSTGTAHTTVIYADAGKMNITAKYVPGTADAGLVMTGNTNFIVSPALFAFTQIRQLSTGAGNPAASSTSGSAFVKAGESFSAVITALNTLGNPTKNYGQEIVPSTVAVISHLVQPAAGAAGFLANSSFTPFMAGASTAVMNWSEVGIITLQAVLNNPGYLGSTLVPTGTSGNVGRFYPDHFTDAIVQGCSAGNFTYSGQPLTVQLTAMNSATGTTIATNYDATAGFSRNVTLSEISGQTNGTLSNAVISASSFVNGQSSTLAPTFTFLTQATTGRTVGTTITLRGIDADGVSSAGFAEGSSKILSGRVSIDNAHGSELAMLLMPMQAQYWNGKAWVLNAADVCTGDPAIPNNQVVASLTNSATLACVLDSGSPGLSAAGCNAPGPSKRRYIKGGVTPFAGDFNLALLPMVKGTTGSTIVKAVVPTWLRFKWGTSPGAVDPSGIATFGVYPSGPITHMWETFN